MSILLYLLKASACTVAFYLVYRVFLNRLTFFGFNRIYLLATMALSFIIPAIHFSITQQTATGSDMINDEHFDAGISATRAAIKNIATTDPAYNITNIGLYIYLAIAIILGLKLCMAIGRLLILGRKRGAEHGQFTIVRHAKGLQNSSFFNTIFLDKDVDPTEERLIIDHEAEHIHRFHSIDILLMEISKVVLWFNPVVYLFKKSLEQVHEYEVDAAITNRYDRKDYASMLLKLSGFKSPALVNSFSGSQLSKRVNMLFKGGSRQIKKAMYVLTIPVIAGLTWFLCVDHVYAQSTINIDEFTVVIDAGHGGKNSGGVINGYTEKDLALSIAKAVKAAGDAEGMNILLTRSEDISMSVDERLSKKADLLISLHVNSGPYDKKLNGILAITSTKPENTSSVQLASSCLAELGRLKGIATLQDVKTQNIAVLRSATVPATLLELGYLTNTNDLRFVADPTNQAQMATSIINGIKQYRLKIK